jgi:hypothetical protein
VSAVSFLKSSTEKRERHDYNGAVTALTDVEWMQLVSKRHGAWVVVIDEHVVYEGVWLTALGYFLLNTHAGDRVKLVGHTDFVMRRVASALLES